MTMACSKSKYKTFALTLAHVHCAQMNWMSFLFIHASIFITNVIYNEILQWYGAMLFIKSS